MEREQIDVIERATDIMRGLKRGALFTVRTPERVNTMTIGWGMLGIEWRRPLFIAYIRTDRFTHTLLDAVDDFTVSMPDPAADDGADRKRAGEILAGCGRTSGRDHDKVAACGITLVDGRAVASPAVAELPLTLECRIIYRRDQDTSLMPAELRDSIYPAAAPGEPPVVHTALYGEIADAYILR